MMIVCWVSDVFFWWLPLSPALSPSLYLALLVWMAVSKPLLFVWPCGHSSKFSDNYFLASKPLSTPIGKTGANVYKSNDNHIETMVFPSMCPCTDFLHMHCAGPVWAHWTISSCLHNPFAEHLLPGRGHLWSHLIIVIDCHCHFFPMIPMMAVTWKQLKPPLDVLFRLSSGTE